MKIKSLKIILGICLTLLPTQLQVSASNAATALSCVNNLTELATIERPEIQVCPGAIFDIEFEDGVIIALPDPGFETTYSQINLDGSEISHKVGLSSEYILSIEAVENSNSHSSLIDNPEYLTTLFTDGGGDAGLGDIGCLFSTYSSSGARFHGTFNWYYDPRGESSPRALSRILDGLGYWQTPENRCDGSTFSTNFKAKYLGVSTSKQSRVGATGCTGPFDGQNLVSWKNRGSTSLLGATCRNVNSNATRITEADIIFNTYWIDSYYDQEDAAACPRMEYLLANIAAHEFGHALGLEHVNSSTRQIMSTKAIYCTLDKPGLAPGDYSGLMQIYGLDNSNVAI